VLEGTGQINADWGQRAKETPTKWMMGALFILTFMGATMADPEAGRKIAEEVYALHLAGKAPKKLTKEETDNLEEYLRNN